MSFCFLVMTPLQKPSFSENLPNSPVSNLLKNSVFSLFTVESVIDGRWNRQAILAQRDTNCQRSAITQIGIKGIAQGIAQEVEGEHGKREGQCRKEDHMRRGTQCPIPITDHAAPTGDRGLHP